MSIENIKKAIRDVPDFPKKGIIFKDITPVLGDPALFREIIDELAKKFCDKGIKKIVAIESRGFIFGAALSYKMGIGFVPVRKKGKLPYRTVSETYELEYGTDTLEIHEDALSGKDEKVLIIDDLLATGGTAGAVGNLVKKIGGRVYGIVFLVELGFLKGRDKLKGFEVTSLIEF